jgi:hypothetical protein
MSKNTIEHDESPTLDQANLELYAEEHIHGLDVPKVTWWKHKGLRRLYLMVPILFLSATTNGYDSSLLNGLQTLTPWQDCMVLFHFLTLATLTSNQSRLRSPERLSYRTVQR